MALAGFCALAQTQSSTVHVFVEDDDEVICSSFYPTYQCRGQQTTLQASEQMACMQECAAQEDSGCCQFIEGLGSSAYSCTFASGSFSVAKATSSHKDDTSISFCEAEDKNLVEMHDATATSNKHTYTQHSYGYSYGYSYGTTGKHAPACICKTSWSSTVGGEQCSETQSGCTNCDQTSDGSIGWCQVEDTSCATAERGHGPSFYWSYCTTPPPIPPPLSTSQHPPPPPPPPRPQPPPPTSSSHRKSPPPPARTYSARSRVRHPPPPSPPGEEDDDAMGFSIAFSLLGLVLGVGLAFYALRVLRRSPLLRLLGMRKAANDIEMDLSLRPQNAGQSHEEVAADPLVAGWS